MPKKLLCVDHLFVKKLNMSNSSRFILREDAVSTLYANNSTKSRRILLFNDLLILCKNNHWNSKLQLIEKVPLKDVRLFEITEKEEATAVLEMEILPQFESDSVKRYLIAFTSLGEKSMWITSYKSLLRTAVKSKSMSEVSLVEESHADDDADQQRELPRDLKAMTNNEMYELSEKIANLEKDVYLRTTKMNAITLENESWQKKCAQLQAELEESKKESTLTRPEEISSLLTEKESVITELAKLLAEKDSLLLERASAIEVKESILISQTRSISEKEAHITSLTLKLDQTLKENQSRSDIHERELLNIKDQLVKANESLLARVSSNERLNRNYADQMNRLINVSSNEEALKTQVLELQVQVASLELSNSQAQNQVEDEKKELLALLESKQQDLVKSDHKMKEMEEEFMDEAKTMNEEYNHLQFEMSEETKSKKKEIENNKSLTAKVKILEDNAQMLTAELQEKTRKLETLNLNMTNLQKTTETVDRNTKEREAQISMKLESLEKENIEMQQLLNTLSSEKTIFLAGITNLSDINRNLLVDKTSLTTAIKNLESENAEMINMKQNLELVNNELTRRLDHKTQEALSLIAGLESGKQKLESQYDGQIKSLTSKITEMEQNHLNEKRSILQDAELAKHSSMSLEKSLAESIKKCEALEQQVFASKEDNMKIMNEKAHEKEALAQMHSDQLKLKVAIIEAMEISKNSLQENLKFTEKKLIEAEKDLHHLKEIHVAAVSEAEELRKQMNFLESEKVQLQSANIALSEQISKQAETYKYAQADLEMKLKRALEEAYTDNNTLHRVQTDLSEKTSEIGLWTQKYTALQQEFRYVSSEFQEKERLLKNEYENMVNLLGIKKELESHINVLEKESQSKVELYEKYQMQVVEEKLSLTKEFDKQLQAQNSLIQTLEADKSLLLDNVAKQNLDIIAKTDFINSLKNSMEEKENHLLGRIDSLIQEGKTLREEQRTLASAQQKEISDTRSLLQSLQLENHASLKKLSEENIEKQESLSTKSIELAALQAQLSAYKKTIQIQEDKLKEEVDELQAVHLQDIKAIKDLRDNIHGLEQLKLELESSISILNAKLTQSESNISFLKETLSSTHAKIFEDVKLKEESFLVQVKANELAIADLEKARSLLHNAFTQAEENLISAKTDLGKMTAERDQLSSTVSAQTFQLGSLSNENEQLSTRIVQLNIKIDNQERKIADIESRAQSDLSSLIAQKRDMERELASQLSSRDTAIAAQSSKIQILEKSVEEEIVKLSQFEHNPNPNPKELLNAHMLRRKWEDMYRIASNSVDRLEKALQETQKSSDEKIKRIKEDSRLKLEIGAKAITELKMKIEKQTRSIELLQLENSTVTSSLKSANNSLELARNNITEQSIANNGLRDEKEKLLINICALNLQMSTETSSLESRINSLNLESSKEKEALSSQILTLESEKRHLMHELEAATVSHDAFQSAYTTEKSHLLDQIKLLNKNLLDSDALNCIEREKRKADIEEVDRKLETAKSDLETANNELVKKATEKAELLRQISVSTEANTQIEGANKNLNSKLLQFQQLAFTSSITLMATKERIESGLKNQIHSLHQSLDAIKIREIRTRKWAEETIQQLLARCVSLERESQSDTRSFREKIFVLQADIGKLKNEIQLKNTQIAGLKEGSSSLTSQMAILETKTAEMEKQMEDLIAAKSSLETSSTIFQSEKNSLVQSNAKFESVIAAEKEVNGNLLKTSEDLRKTVVALEFRVSEFERDRGTLVEGYEKSLASKTGAINLLEQKVKILQDSLGSDFTKGLNNLQQVAEAEKKLLLAEKKTLEVEKQVIEAEKINLSRELESILSSKEQTVLDLTIKMKDVQQKLRHEIDISHKQVQEMKELYLKEREQHLRTEQELRNVAVLNNELNAKISVAQNSNKELTGTVELVKQGLHDFKNQAAQDLQAQSTTYSKQLLTKSSKIESLHAKNAKLTEQMSQLKREVEVMRVDLTLAQRGSSSNTGAQNASSALISSNSIGKQTPHDTKLRIQQLERDKERISLEAAKSHSNEVRLLNVITEKSSEIRNVMRRIIELEAMNDRVQTQKVSNNTSSKNGEDKDQQRRKTNSSSSSPIKKANQVALKRVTDSLSSDLVILDRQVKFQRQIIQKLGTEAQSLTRTLEEIAKLLNVPFGWKSLPVAVLLQRKSELSNGQVDVSDGGSDHSNTLFLLQIVESLQSMFRDKQKLIAAFEKQKDYLNESKKQQRLANLKLDQSHDVIVHLQGQLGNCMPPGDTLSKRGTPKEFKAARTVAQYEILESLFKKTASELSNCQSYIMELELDKSGIENEFKQLYEKMVSLKSGFEHRLQLAEADHNSIVGNMKSEMDRLRGVIDGLRSQSSKLHLQKSRADELLRESLISAQSLAAFIK